MSTNGLRIIPLRGHPAEGEVIPSWRGYPAKLEVIPSALEVSPSADAMRGYPVTRGYPAGEVIHNGREVTPRLQLRLAQI